LPACCDLLPAQNLPRAFRVSDRRIETAGPFRLQAPGQFSGRHVVRYEDELTDELRILERRRLQQSRQAGQQHLLLMVGNDDLEEHLALRLALENALDPLKARDGAGAVALRDVE